MQPSASTGGQASDILATTAEDLATTAEDLASGPIADDGRFERIRVSGLPLMCCGCILLNAPTLSVVPVVDWDAHALVYLPSLSACVQARACVFVRLPAFVAVRARLHGIGASVCACRSILSARVYACMSRR